MRLTACRVFREQKSIVARMVEMPVDELTPGEVVVRAEWSGINFKDALGVTGRAPIYKRFPINAGIDVAGVVESSADARFRPGDPVLVNGMGLGETQDGGLAQVTRAPADWVVPLPDGLDLRSAMVLGTAGFTAALALHRMEVNGQAPEKGPVVVTGATGGVGSAAVSMLARRGYRVVAVSGRPEHEAYLRGLGAHEVMTPEGLGLGSRPLEAARFGGAIDNVGGSLLAALIPHVALWGNIAAIGNAAGPEFATTVYPFILRGVSLLGASSGNCPMALRAEIWTRLGGDMKPPALDQIVSRTVPLAEVIDACGTLMNRTALGRVLVDCRS
ncbi:MAG: acryloyl-CoA reductase [Acidobacteria bacterium]|nr:MAG: acryloyl-CoA reductase [Acidobacteriota bacterium]RPJ76890.1 MAG: acryloyl-CoA reductase [Acidobacteriota bacterium]